MHLCNEIEKINNNLYYFVIIMKFYFNYILRTRMFGIGTTYYHPENKVQI